MKLAAARTRRLCMAASSLALAHAAPVWSQDNKPAATTDDAPVTDIIVTARRREESILETPVAVSVSSGETLRQKDVVQPADLIKVTPGLTAQVGAESNRRTFRFAIRGQGGTSNNDSGVSTYFSEVPAFGFPFFYDLQNVQVLKGPQGTLFGRVTTGGAVLIVPQMPTDDFSGYVNLKVGQYGRRDVEFAVGGALIPDILSVRLSGQVTKSDGFTTNLYDGSKQDGTDGQAFRAIVKFTPTDWLTNTTIGVLDYIKDPSRSAQITVARPGPGSNQRVAPQIAALNGIACPGGICPTWLDVAQQQVAQQAGRSRYVSNENNDAYPRLNQRHWGIINTTVVEPRDDLTLKNIFSYQATDNIGPSLLNIDATPYPLLEQISGPGKGPRAMTEEFQVQTKLFGFLDFTGGAYYERNWTPTFQQSNTIINGGYSTSVPAASACPSGSRTDAGGDGLNYCYIGARISLSRIINDDTALYAQATAHLTDKLSVTGGYRYTWSRRKTASLNTLTSTSAALTNGTIPSTLLALNGAGMIRLVGDLTDVPGATWSSNNFEQGTYTLAAQYQFTRDFMVYATSRRGYKPGGQNTRAPDGFLRYGPETVTDYEIGAKLSWTMGDLRGLVSADVYRDNYNNAQRNVTQPVNGVSTVYIANVAKARIQGFDVDGSMNYKWFTLGGFVTMTDGKYLTYPNTGQFADYPIAQYPNLTAFELSNISKWLWGIQPSIDFEKMIDGAPRIVLSGNIYHRGRFASSEPDIGPDILKIIPGYTTLDLRLDWRNISHSGLSAALAMTNVTNFNGKVGGNELRTTNGINVDVYSPPRQWYFELNYKF